MRVSRRTLRGDRGQASVELLAATPVILVVGLTVWQFAVAGHAWWRVNETARLAARAVYVGYKRGDVAAGKAEARQSARAMLGRSARVVFTGDHAVRVSSRVPLVWPFSSAGFVSAPSVSASSEFGG